MIRQGLYTSTLGKMLKWAQSQSLWAYHANSACCANEVLQTIGCRYDLERFGCVMQEDPRQADLLIISGVITQKLAPHIKELYDRMPGPKYVISIGSCSNCGGAFSKEPGY
ncbi:MAG: NADH-quinone oxidoreductase subunit NuoB, partial [Bdellovibrionota bacterium]